MQAASLSSKSLRSCPHLGGAAPIDQLNLGYWGDLVEQLPVSLVLRDMNSLAKQPDRVPQFVRVLALMRATLGFPLLLHHIESEEVICQRTLSCCRTVPAIQLQRFGVRTFGDYFNRLI